MQIVSSKRVSTSASMMKGKSRKRRKFTEGKRRSRKVGCLSDAASWEHVCKSVLLSDEFFFLYQNSLFLYINFRV